MTTPAGRSDVARAIHVHGVVQGVGFRPFVYRLAAQHHLSGWVLNGNDGVRILVEGRRDRIDAFVDDLEHQPPAAAAIAAIQVRPAPITGFDAFEIRESVSEHAPTTPIAADLPVCPACLRELFDSTDRRRGYPYINCTDCGPRYSIVMGLPYDRPQTTMAAWPMCAACASEYDDPADRRFHAQPLACPECGPQYLLEMPGVPAVRGAGALAAAARLLASGRIVGIKGIGGYHLACDAANAAAVETLRDRKFRKEKAFAVMVRDLAVADRTVRLTAEDRALLSSAARPIAIVAGRIALPGVAPGSRDLGIMLPYTPLHHLLFAAGAPDRLVMTSGNRSSEPIAREDDDARRRLEGIADALLIGERPIARRVDDSVVRTGVLGPTVLRRSRGLAPGVVATLPLDRPLLAVGGDLKSAITLVVEGQACVSQHIGDLDDRASREAFEESIRDLTSMYGVALRDLTIAHDRHPQYASTLFALSLEARQVIAVQHHRAHVASVLAERGALETRVLGVVFDGTGFGDDGSIWGGELFVGSVAHGLDRVAHLREAALPGGDAAARHPVQAAAGFLTQLDDRCDFSAPPFSFPVRYAQACAVARSGVRTFTTTSAGRLFDAAAAVAGFTRGISFEGQAAMWLEQLARSVDPGEPLRMPLPGFDPDSGVVDWRPVLDATVGTRAAGLGPERVALVFHQALAGTLADAVRALADRHAIDIVVLSGGVFQNALLVELLDRRLTAAGLTVWTNQLVPPNDGGLSLGQAALAISSVRTTPAAPLA